MCEGLYFSISYLINQFDNHFQLLYLMSGGYDQKIRIEVIYWSCLFAEINKYELCLVNLHEKWPYLHNISDIKANLLDEVLFT